MYSLFLYFDFKKKIVSFLSKFGVLSQTTKNKTYTPKNICSSASKDRSHGEYLA